MSKTMLRVVLLLLLAGVVSASGFTVFGPRDPASVPGPNPGGPGSSGGFTPCPSPPCMAPCIFPPQPEVTCKAPDGSVSVTSFTCCCCGGSENEFKPL